MIDRLVDAVRGGESRVLVVRGEPGVGKSTLLGYLDKGRRVWGGAGGGVEPRANVRSVMKIRLDHCVIHVSDRSRSNVFYRTVLGAELVGDADGVAMYRFGDEQLNVHGPGL